MALMIIPAGALAEDSRQQAYEASGAGEASGTDALNEAGGASVAGGARGTGEAGGANSSSPPKIDSSSSLEEGGEEAGASWAEGAPALIAGSGLLNIQKEKELSIRNACIPGQNVNTM